MISQFPILCHSVHCVLKKQSDTEGRALANPRVLGLQSFDLPHLRYASCGMTGKG
jgi:hypothetical protein